ncbi:hypothetical protein CEE45_10765 [Candidatus Heimdallarchaeota archaeon B3_Heim]|nr:MAG: hypothetical protein CEE45_10765 [Candidatus Heimdallarchaeota archaeon B3_Heim]
MSSIPNLPFFDSLLIELGREYDVPVRLSRYASAAPELLTLATNAGLTEDEGARALFVADFITTASEVPSEASDEDRYSSIFEAFKSGRSRNKSPDKLMHVFYVAYKTAIKMRSQDLFMGGRGMPRDVSLIRLKDYFISPYLKRVSNYLSKGPCGWEFALLSAALKRTYPHEEIQSLKIQSDNQKHSDLLAPIWKLLKEHEALHVVIQNSSVTIANMNETQAFLLFNTKQASLISSWNVGEGTKVSKLQTPFQKVTSFLNRPILNSDIVMLRGRILNTLEHFMLVRDAFSPANPMLIMKTPADDLNAANVAQILHLRGLDESKAGTWKNTLSGDQKSKPRPATPTTPKLQGKEATPVKKKGFFGRLLGKIRKSEEIDQQSPTPSAPKVSVQEKPSRGLLKRGSFATDATFIPQALVIEAVSNIQIVDTFDTLREGNYSIEGIFETDLKSNVTTFLSKPSLGLASTIMTFLTNLQPYLTDLFQNAFQVEDFLIEELFFTTDAKEKYIIKMDGNQHMTVGLLAQAPPDAHIEDWKTRGEDLEPLQRKSLAMRTNQYLKARRHSSFEDSTERIFGQNFAVSTAKKDTFP